MSCSCMSVFALLAVVTACGSGDGGEPAAVDAMSSPDPDALAQCVDEAQIEFGVCQLADNTPCTSAADAGQRFVALADGATVPTVVGFQGLSMYALAMRTRGIAPGDPDTPQTQPNVDVGLFDDQDEIVSSYQRQVAFAQAAGDATTFEMLSVYLVVGSGIELQGKTLAARGTVTDRDGVTKCGTRLFVGGMP